MARTPRPLSPPRPQSEEGTPLGEPDGNDPDASNGIFASAVNGRAVRFFFYTKDDGMKRNITPRRANALARTVKNHGGEVVEDEEDADTIIVKDGNAAEEYSEKFNNYRNSIYVESTFFIARCIRDAVYNHLPVAFNGISGPRGPRQQRLFTGEDDHNLASYLAVKIPIAGAGGRTGNNIYKNLVELARKWPDKYAWVKRHTWNGWRERYKRRRESIDELIEAFLRKNPMPADGKGLFPYCRSNATRGGGHHLALQRPRSSSSDLNPEAEDDAEENFEVTSSRRRRQKRASQPEDEDEDEVEDVVRQRTAASGEVRRSNVPSNHDVDDEDMSPWEIEDTQLLDASEPFGVPVFITKTPPLPVKDTTAQQSRAAPHDSPSPSIPSSSQVAGRSNQAPSHRRRPSPLIKNVALSAEMPLSSQATLVASQVRSGISRSAIKQSSGAPARAAPADIAQDAAHAPSKRPPKRKRIHAVEPPSPAQADDAPYRNTRARSRSVEPAEAEVPPARPADKGKRKANVAVVPEEIEEDIAQVDISKDASSAMPPPNRPARRDTDDERTNVRIFGPEVAEKSAKPARTSSIMDDIDLDDLLDIGNSEALRMSLSLSPRKGQAVVGRVPSVPGSSKGRPVKR